MKPRYIIAGMMLILAFLSHPGFADDYEFKAMDKSFENFITCELTRTNAKNYFKGKPFKITMIDLFNIQHESDIMIVTGAVDCFVVDQHRMLYAAVGVKEILGKKQVVYLTIRPYDFSILATELMQYPYKERCRWSQYWIDID